MTTQTSTELGKNLYLALFFTDGIAAVLTDPNNKTLRDMFTLAQREYGVPEKESLVQAYIRNETRRVTAGEQNVENFIREERA